MVDVREMALGDVMLFLKVETERCDVGCRQRVLDWRKLSSRRRWIVAWLEV